MSFKDLHAWTVAVPLFCLAVYQFSQGQTDQALTSLLAGLAALGLIHKN